MRRSKILFALLSCVAAAACSSGLGENMVCNTATVGSKSGNLTTGLFFGFDLRAPVTEHAAAGGLVAGATRLTDRNVIFYAFVTDAPANDAGAAGGNRVLDRHGLGDGNGAADVFVAAVVDQAIDQRAFSYSLAGKFRHPRCASCHSLAEPDMTVFQNTPHPGRPPGHPDLQGQAESPTNLCMGCHRFALNALETPGSFDVAWRNPPRSLDADLRKLGTAQLAERARSAAENHFARDRRVDWALSSGVFTTFSPEFANDRFAKNATGIVVGGADDDQDGVLEPSDEDGRRRTVPGGRADFLTEIEAFRCGGPTDTRDAIADVALVSRRSDAAQAGNGASSQPAVAYAPNEAYVPGSVGTAGTLFVAFASTANDIVTGVTGNFSQVYRARFEVRVGQDGSIALVYLATDLVSNAGAAGGDNDSDSPSISASGARIAFASAASNLAPIVGTTRQVYVRELSTGAIARVSEGGTSASGAPAIDPSGTVVAFESLHDFDGGSPSGLTDVYYAELFEPLSMGVAFQRRASRPNPAGGSDTTGASRQPDVVRATSGEILVAFTSVNDLDTVSFGDPAPLENTYLHRDNGGVRSTTLISVAPNALGAVVLPDGASRTPSFAGPDRLLIETDATNLDARFLLPPDPTFGVTTFKSGDENSSADVVMLDLSGFLAGAGAIRAEAISVSPAGAFGDRGSVIPVAGRFAAPAMATTGAYRAFAVLLTQARNLGAADNHVGLLPGDATPWLSYIR